MIAKTAIEISHASCKEEIESIETLISEAAKNKKMEVSIPFELANPTVHYLRHECNFMVDGSNSSFHWENGKKIYWTVSWR